jgi:diguanylate cyclase (GGDEF)-like protein
VGKALTSTLKLDEVLKTIMDKIHEFLHPDTWSLLLLDESTHELYFEIATGGAAAKLKDLRLKLGQGIAGWVAQTGEAVVVPNVREDARFMSQVDKMTQTTTESIVCVPVRSKERILGVIELVNCVSGDAFGRREMALLQALADYAAIAIENARHMERITELTITDDCTSLYNVRYLHAVMDKEIHRSSRHGQEFSVIFIDLDNFKAINDQHSHLVGSRLLAEIGEILKNHCRLIDYAFRYGGDEFVVLLPQTPKDAAGVVARRLHQLISDTVFLEHEGLNLRITASLGIATYPGDAKSRIDLLRLADQAMYLVKNTGKNNVAAANVGILPELQSKG